MKEIKKVTRPSDMQKIKTTEIKDHITVKKNVEKIERQKEEPKAIEKPKEGLDSLNYGLDNITLTIYD